MGREEVWLEWTSSCVNYIALADGRDMETVATQLGRVAQKRNPPERESSFTSENPAAQRRSAISARSMGTNTLPTWITRCNRLSSISNARKEPPGRKTRKTSRKALSWAARVRRWCNIKTAMAEEKVRSANRSEAASACTTAFRFLAASWVANA